MSQFRTAPHARPKDDQVEEEILTKENPAHASRLRAEAALRQGSRRRFRSGVADAAFRERLSLTIEQRPTRQPSAGMPGTPSGWAAPEPITVGWERYMPGRPPRDGPPRTSTWVRIRRFLVLSMCDLPCSRLSGAPTRNRAPIHDLCGLHGSHRSNPLR